MFPFVLTDYMPYLDRNTTITTANDILLVLFRMANHQSHLRCHTRSPILDNIQFLFRIQTSLNYHVE